MTFIVNIGSALIFPILGIALLFFCTRVLRLEVKTDGAFILTIIATPLVGYLIFSGQLTEFKGIGLELRFRDLAIQNVDVQKAVEVTGEEPGISTTYFSGGSPVVEIKIEELRDAESDKMLWYAFYRGAEIAANIQQGVFQGVILTDSNKFVGAIPQSYFLDLLGIGCLHTSASRSSECESLFVQNKSIPCLTQQQLKRTYLWDILISPKDRAEDYGSRIQHWGKGTITYRRAFELFSNSDVDFIVVTDSEDHYKGIVTREQINSCVLSVFTKVGRLEYF